MAIDMIISPKIPIILLLFTFIFFPFENLFSLAEKIKIPLCFDVLEKSNFYLSIQLYHTTARK